MARDDVGPPTEIDARVGFGHPHPESAADVQPADFRMCVENPRGSLQHPVEHVERIALVSAADVKVQRIDLHAG